MPKHLLHRRGVWQYRRRVPGKYRHLDPRDCVWYALGDIGEAEAVRKAAALDADLERYWSALALGDESEAAKRAAAMDEIARSHGFSLVPAADLARGDLDEILRRLDYLEAQRLEGEGAVVEALIGAEAGPPPFKLSDALEFFFDYTRDEQAGKDHDQLRVWRNPRKAVFKDLIDTIDDIDLASLTRQHLLDYRTVLMERVEAGEIKAATANKYLSYFFRILGTVCDARGIDAPRTDKLKFRTVDLEQRLPYSVEFIRDRLLAPGALAGLNAEARNVVFAMVETGMRPSEIVNIDPENIMLKAKIPHVRVRWTDDRELKTTSSIRDIPLVGVSLRAFQEQRAGFERYRGRNASGSGAINKYLRENGLKPGPRFSLYSLRHSFKQRLLESRASESVIDALMGHASDKPKYGTGPTLAMKVAALRAIEIRSPSK